MSKSTVPKDRHTADKPQISVLHHLDILVGVGHKLRRQSQQSCALWHASLALAVLAVVRISYANSSRPLRIGGAYRDRTDDLMLAKQPLSQLS